MLRHFDVAIHMLQALLRGDLRRQVLMQLQRDVGIFGGIVRGGVDIHLVEADLFRALARHFGEADGLHVEMAQREVVHVVRLVAFQHVGLQQRVVVYTRKPDAVIGEDMHVVFEVLPELVVLRAFQPVLEFGERVCAIELIRRTGIDVRQRQIGGLVRL